MILALYKLPEWAGPVAHYILHVGLPLTLKIAAASVVASTLIGILFGTLLTIDFLPTRLLIRLYIEVWRGLPLIVTIFLIYFALPKVNPWFTEHLDAFRSVSVGLTLWGSAQVAEATRGAVASIPREQHEAASALGFGWVGRHAHVILPQAIRRLLPPLVSLLVNVIQNSTIAALVGSIEVLGAAQSQVNRLSGPPPAGIVEIHAFEIFGFVLALFFVISFPLTRLAAFLERRLV